MLDSRSGLVAAIALAVGLAGCSLPEVLPLTGATTSGPSPYGPWYEQHWATNAVLLAAADQPGGESAPSSEEIDAALSGGEPTGEAASPESSAVPEAGSHVEANAIGIEQPKDFDTSSPYQFPASSYAPAAPDQGVGASDVLVPAKPQAPSPETAPAPQGKGPIRY